MSDEQTLKDLARYKELVDLRDTQLLKCQDRLVGLTESREYLYRALSDHRGLADIALPRYPDKTDVLATFNRFLEYEKEYERLVKKLREYGIEYQKADGGIKISPSERL